MLPTSRISRGAAPASRVRDRRVRQVSRAPGADRAFLRPPPRHRSVPPSADCRASVLEPRRSWSTRHPVLPAPYRHVSWGRGGGRVQGGASALKGTGHGAREAAPFETARGAWCEAGLGGWWGVGPSGFARGRVVRWERGGVSRVRAAFWAEFRLGGLAPAAPSSRCLGWGGQDSFIPGRGNS